MNKTREESDRKALLGVGGVHWWPHPARSWVPSSLPQIPVNLTQHYQAGSEPALCQCCWCCGFTVHTELFGDLAPPAQRVRNSEGIGWSCQHWSDTRIMVCYPAYCQTPMPTQHRALNAEESFSSKNTPGQVTMKRKTLRPKSDSESLQLFFS